MAFVQGRSSQAAAVTQIVLAYTSAVVPGNLLTAGAQAASLAGLAGTDSVNGAWSVAINHATGNTSNDPGIVYKASTAAGTPSVTVSWTTSSDASITIEEYSGVITASPLDLTVGNDAAAATSITSNSITTTGANGDLVVSTLSSANQNVTYSNSTAGWSVNVNNSPNVTMDAAFASRQQVPSGAVQTTWGVTGAAQDLSVAVASFKLASSGIPQILYGYGAN